MLILVGPRLIYAQQKHTVITLMNNGILFPTVTYSKTETKKLRCDVM